MLINGWVTPKYLDVSWYQNFTVSRLRKTQNDIPIVISIHDKAYESAKVNNRMPSYGDLENKIISQAETIKKLEFMVENGLGPKDMEQDI